MTKTPIHDKHYMNGKLYFKQETSLTWQSHFNMAIYDMILQCSAVKTQSIFSKILKIDTPYLTRMGCLSWL